MNKKTVLLIAFTLILNSVCAFAADNSRRAQRVKEQKVKQEQTQQREQSTTSASGLDTETIYYPDANIQSAVAKYKNGNYSGCLQELFSLTKKDPSNAVAYYYMAMSYTYLDMKNAAVEAYEKVIELKPNSYIADYAEKGKDCLTNGPKCHPEIATEEQDELDKFINAPYGNGLSPALNGEVKQKELNNIKETINKKENLEVKDLEKIREFDTKHNNQNNQSYAEETDKIAMASDEEILQAVKTLKDAGLNITVQSDNPYAPQYQNQQAAEMSMLLGNSNNNNNTMMNMLPMLMTKAQNGENIDPRIMQTMMMSSMMSDLNYGGNNNDRY